MTLRMNLRFLITTFDPFYFVWITCIVLCNVYEIPYVYFIFAIFIQLYFLISKYPDNKNSKNFHYFLFVYA